MDGQSQSIDEEEHGEKDQSGLNTLFEAEYIDTNNPQAKSFDLKDKETLKLTQKDNANQNSDDFRSESDYFFGVDTESEQIKHDQQYQRSL